MAVWSDILWPIEIYIGFMDPCVDFMAWVTVWKEMMNKKLSMLNQYINQKVHKHMELDFGS